MLANWCIRAVPKVLRPIRALASARFQSTLSQPIAEQAQDQSPLLTLDDDLLNATLRQDDAFAVSSLVSVEEMFLHRVHLGHKTSTLNEHMNPFIFGSRFDHLIINLEKTRQQMVAALNFIAHIAYRDGIILFVTRKHQTAHKVEKCAQACAEFAHTRAWQKGQFTNATNMFNAEVRLPDCVVFLSTIGSTLAITECSKMLIPTVGIVDTDSDPRLICYPIAGNDDTPASCDLYCKYFQMAILRGKARRKKDITGQQGQTEGDEAMAQTHALRADAPGR